MAPPDRDTFEVRLWEEHATRAMEGVSNGGLTVSPYSWTCAHLVLDSDDHVDNAENSATSAVLSHRTWQKNPLYTGATTIMRRLIPGWREYIDSRFPSSFEYTPIEMNDRGSRSAGSNSNKIQVNKWSMEDLVDGSRVAGNGIEATNPKSKAIPDQDGPGQKSVNHIVSSEGSEPTQEELATLRKVADHLPWSTYIVALVELCERFTYYGLSGPFQNYIQYNPHDSPVRGALGTVDFFLSVLEESWN